MKKDVFRDLVLNSLEELTDDDVTAIKNEIQNSNLKLAAEVIYTSKVNIPPYVQEKTTEWKYDNQNDGETSAGLLSPSAA